MSSSDDRDRQSAEIALLQSMYPTELTLHTPDTADDISSPDATPPDPRLTISLNADYTLDLTLPPTYPSSTRPHAYLDCAGTVPTATRKAARATLSAILAAQETGSECLDLVVQELTQSLDDLVAEITQPDPSAGRGADDGSGGKNADRIKTVLLWSHHLLATSKRKDIVAWSRELRLGGYSRPGYPGAILIEGVEDEVDEFVRRIKALRWQALQVRGEEVGSERRLGSGEEGVREVEGLGDVVDDLRKKNRDLADWFLEGMKIAHG